MEINKQLFEDVLSSKLTGTFVLRNGEIYSSTNLCQNDSIFEATHPYKLGIRTYTPIGRYLQHGTSKFDIIDFMPTYKTIDSEMLEYCRKDFEFMQTLSKAINNMNALEIEIPEGKEVDWKESEKQNKIVLKDKQLTYKDICKKLFENKEFFFTNAIRTIESSSAVGYAYLINAINNSTSYHQLECILAKNKLANVAKYLNNGWEPGRTDLGHFDAWVLYTTPNKNFIGWIKISNCSQNSNVLFKSSKLAAQAIKILGEETIKLALEPLGI